MKKLIITIIVIILIVLAVIYFGPKKEVTNIQGDQTNTTQTNVDQTNPNAVKATYSDGTNTVVAFYDNTNNTVTFSVNDTRENILPVAVSGSGARYANEDESLVFWEHQNELTVTKNGVEVFKGQKVEN